MAMVIGKGVIANRFMDYSLLKKNLIFAGNIHDSSITDENIFRAEEDSIKLALAQNPQVNFVYFSSCCILDPNESKSYYSIHKEKMEKLIMSSARNYLILRLPQIIGLNDEKTSLVSYLVENVFSGKSFDLWEKAYRNFIDIDDVYHIVHYILGNKTHSNCAINIANPSKTSIIEAVKALESFFNRKANYQMKDLGTSYDIKVSEISDIIKLLNINFGSDYFIKAVEKYWRHLIDGPKLLSIVVPTYNEEHGIEEFYKRTKTVMQTLEPRFNHEFIFVNDFSTDKTLEKLKILAEKDKTVKVINFSRNFGNQIGITAGIDYSNGDVVVVIDDDLQDPPEVILNFLSIWSTGFKVVYGVRPKRQGVNFFFKMMAKLYYRIIGGLSDTVIPKDTGDFRLIDRLVVDKLKLMKEENRYYRGMVAWVGYSQTGWLYERDRRYAGTSTFSFWKYINFAFNGLTSFTDKPLYFSSLAGFIITMVGFCFAVIIIVDKLINPDVSIRGWTSLSALVIFFGGVQLLSIGVVGIYISKIYREVKSRPLYLIESTKNWEDK
jgi:glycosyltransferase involved in cell wall biosynthesis